MYNHILIPVAPGHQGEYADALAAARNLMEAGGKISVLAVIEEMPSYIGTYVAPYDIDKNVTDVLNDLKTEFRDEGVTCNVISGHPANSILDWAGANDVDCIVVSSHRPGLSDYFIGSTAARVVRHARCSVHVLR